jgi:hypothetical protein
MASGPVRAEDVAAEKVDWLYQELIPRGMLTIVAGRPDQGKGLFSVFLGAQITRMGGNVLHSAIEDSHSLITRPRYEAAGAVLSRVHLWRFQIPRMLEELEAIIVKNSIDLIIMDPMAASLSHGVSRHSDNIRTVLTPLTEGILETHGVACVCIDHALKRIPKGSHPLNAIGGSGSGLVAAARMAYVLGVDPDDDDRRILAPVKANIRDMPMSQLFSVDTAEVKLRFPDGHIEEDEQPYLMFEEEIDFDPMRLFEAKTDGQVGRKPEKRATAAEWLASYLHAAGGPVRNSRVKEDAKQFGITTKTLMRAAADMRVVKTPPGGGPRVTWDLPDDIKDLMRTDKTAPNAHAADDQLKITDDDIDKLLGGEPEKGDEV